MVAQFRPVSHHVAESIAQTGREAIHLSTQNPKNDTLTAWLEGRVQLFEEAYSLRDRVSENNLYHDVALS